MNDNIEQKSALVVDDSRTQRDYLKALLEEQGYRVYTANDGQAGVDMFRRCQPDIILMDINMPIMNGFEAAKIIKSERKKGFAPLIFVTTMDSEKTMLESAQVGGDGILVMPFSSEVFKAKIMSLQRISDLYQQLNVLQETQQHDAELAEQLMASVIDSRNYTPNNISIVKQAASLFSGDIQLSELCPNGDVNILLGDFTGHGLRSSIGAIPVAETFRSMTRKGFSLLEVASQINQQLYDLLPSDLFLAAGLVTISFDEKSFYAINAGVPDIFHINEQGNVVHRISSSHPPLGIMDKLMPSLLLEVHGIEINEHLLLISDGVLEAKNKKHDLFGEQRLLDAINCSSSKHQLANDLLSQVNEFGNGIEQHDDISIINIMYQTPSVSTDNWPTHRVENLAEISLSAVNEKPAWSWQVVLNDRKLASVNPVPLAMNQLKDLEEDGEHWQSVYTILTELYINALDHGILGLDSTLKDSANGFSRYFKLRTEKLSEKTVGSIAITIDLFTLQNGGKVLIKVKDSGQGFDVESVLKKRINNEQGTSDLSGRGIELVSKLCETLNYHEYGTSVEASYLWD